MQSFLGLTNPEAIYGKSFGEITGCEHATSDPQSCGLSTHCQSCMFFRSLNEAKSNNLVVQELTLKNAEGQSVVFRGWVKSLQSNGGNVFALLLQDISDEKRRETLERVFFHDFLNAASGISGFLDIINLDEMSKEEAREMLITARLCAEYLVDEINFSRSLASAEKATLDLSLEPLNINKLIEKAVGFFAMNIELGHVKLEVVKSVRNSSIISDKSLVVRVLINLIKNAIEASRPGGVVSVRVDEAMANQVVFVVHNESVMPNEVREQIFKRAFSTKGKGRGVGTYSVKLFTEQYLKGKVWFTSEEGRGTSFFVQHGCHG